MTSVILFVFGIVVGSFLNVVGLRWDKKDFGGRSKCPNCSKALSWFELVPILSFIFQRGRCKSCQSRISYEYPLIEILTGLIFVTVPLWLLPVFSIYIVIIVYDFQHKIIPDPLVYAAILVSSVSRLWLGGSTLDWLAGPILFVFFGLIWLLSRGRAMGFGDAKLGLSIGLLLGAISGFSAIVLAFWLGALGSLFYVLLERVGFIKDVKSLTMKSEVPFAPFIVAGAWISLVSGLDILHVASF